MAQKSESDLRVTRNKLEAPKVPREIDVRHWMGKHWDGWIEFREPARGTGLGAPDCQIMLPDGFIVPIEFKVGGFMPGKGFQSTPLRPAQIEWHRRFVLHGGIALLAGGFYFPPKDRHLGDGLQLGLITGRMASKFVNAKSMLGLQFRVADEYSLRDRIMETLLEEEDVLSRESDQHQPY